MVCNPRSSSPGSNAPSAPVAPGIIDTTVPQQIHTTPRAQRRQTSGWHELCSPSLRSRDQGPTVRSHLRVGLGSLDAARSSAPLFQPTGTRSALTRVATATPRAWSCAALSAGGSSGANTSSAVSNRVDTSTSTCKNNCAISSSIARKRSSHANPRFRARLRWALSSRRRAGLSLSAKNLGSSCAIRNKAAPDAAACRYGWQQPGIAVMPWSEVNNSPAICVLGNFVAFGCICGPARTPVRAVVITPDRGPEMSRTSACFGFGTARDEADLTAAEETRSSGLVHQAPLERGGQAIRSKGQPGAGRPRRCRSRLATTRPDWRQRRPPATDACGSRSTDPKEFA